VALFKEGREIIMTEQGATRAKAATPDRIEGILNWCGSHKTGTWNKKKLAQAKKELHKAVMEGMPKKKKFPKRSVAEFLALPELHAEKVGFNEYHDKAQANIAKMFGAKAPSGEGK
jgi:hypothetical protein